MRATRNAQTVEQFNMSGKGLEVFDWPINETPESLVMDVGCIRRRFIKPLGTWIAIAMETRQSLKLSIELEKLSNPWAQPYKNGTVVWAHMEKNSRKWPAVVVSHKDIGMEPPKFDQSWVLWFGDHRVSKLNNKLISPFINNFNSNWNSNAKSKGIKWKYGVYEAIKELGQQKTAELTEDELFQFATNGGDGNSLLNYQSEFMVSKLENVRNKSNKKDLKVKTAAFGEEKELLRLIDRGLKPIQQICLACYSTDIVEDHPVFQGSLCKECKFKIKNTYYVKGDDGIKYFCSICACPGDMIICAKSTCGSAFCNVCISDLAKPGARRRILVKNPWLCFICAIDNENDGLIQVRLDWQERVRQLFAKRFNGFIAQPSIPEKKGPIRVLSLFDGIATGLATLSKLNISIEKYYACEIHEESMKVAKKNFGDKIVYLGDVKDLADVNVRSLMPIDLLIGGSPCNDLSRVNPYRKKLYDPEGTAALFFEFHRILSVLQSHNGKPFFWLFENVSTMPLDSKSTFSRFLQTEPVVIDAAWVSPQSRPRYFWGNFPTLDNQMFAKEGPELQNYLTPGRKAVFKKLRTVTTSNSSLKQGPSMEYPVVNAISLEDNLSIVELEKIFGFPANYTEIQGLSDSNRQKLLGKAWSVQVISMIFRCLQDYFLTC